MNIRKAMRSSANLLLKQESKPRAPEDEASFANQYNTKFDYGK